MGWSRAPHKRCSPQLQLAEVLSPIKKSRFPSETPLLRRIAKATVTWRPPPKPGAADALNQAVGSGEAAMVELPPSPALVGGLGGSRPDASRHGG